jgi:hypothetical protein
MKSKSGFILFIVLVFLQIFSLISLYSLTMIESTMKSGNHLWQGYIFRQKSESYLHKLETYILQKNNCIIPITPAVVLKNKSSQWWQLNTCHENVNEIQYYFVVEVLGEDDCAIIESSQNINAQYYRITLNAKSSQLSNSHYILQSTIALPSSNIANCDIKPHLIKQGRQSFREL